jgi:hypothetical protein
MNWIRQVMNVANVQRAFSREAVVDSREKE